MHVHSPSSIPIIIATRSTPLSPSILTSKSLFPPPLPLKYYVCMSATKETSDSRLQLQIHDPNRHVGTIRLQASLGGDPDPLFWLATSSF